MRLIGLGACLLSLGLLACSGGKSSTERLLTPVPMPSPSIPASVIPIPPPGSWSAPVGIPAPAFGINDSHLQYAGQSFDFGSGPQPYPDAGNGPYTHYIDRSSPACTDSSNPFGSPAHPRCNLPAVLPEGSVAEVHGGTYTSSGDKIVVTANGTAARPVFIRGTSSSSRPLFDRKILPQGSYVIFENLQMDNVAFDIRPYNGATIFAIAIRDCELAGRGISGVSGIAISGVAGVVLLRNHIHHFGNSTNTAEADNHGVSVSGGASYVWVLDNHIHHNGGDAFQMKEGSRYIFVGRNTLHEDRENAVDIKLGYDVVVSQNLMYGYQASSSSAGEATVIHLDPARVWFIDNFVAYANFGLVSTGSSSLYVIGNTFWKLFMSAGDTHDSTSAYRSGAGIHFYSTADIHVLNNTFSDTVNGIGGIMNASTSNAEITNNIFGTVDASLSGHQLILQGNATTYGASRLLNNLFFQAGGSSSRVLAGAFGQDSGNRIDQDPSFQDSASGDFRLLGGSVAIDAGLPLSAYATYQSNYTVDIARDIAGTVRPQGGAMDLGAWETP